MLLSALMLGTIATQLPPVKAQDPVRFYVWTAYTTPPGNVIPGVAQGGFVVVEVWVDSPPEWDDTADGIAAYSLSMRVDPRALTVYEAYPADKMRPAGQPPTVYPPGFLEEFLLEYGYAAWSVFPPPGGWTGYKTVMLVGDANAALGYTLDLWEGIEAGETLGKGAGGTSKLCQFFFLSASGTLGSPIDICGRLKGVPSVVVEKASYWTPDGTEHDVDVMDDGYYRAETPDIVFMDALGASPFDPTLPIGSHWHELCPTYCQEWRLDSWEENTDGILSESDQIDMTNLADESVTWYHVEWVNPTPVEGDGKADMIATVKEIVPEFPLGSVAPIALIAVVAYIWWVTKRKTQKVM